MSVPGKKNIVLIGSSGHAKVIIDIIEKEGAYGIIGLIDSFKKAGESSYDYVILGKEEDLPSLAKKHNLHGCFIAIGDNWKRHLVKQKISEIAPSLNYVSAVHPSAQIARNVKVGIGTAVMAGAIINGDSSVGRFCIINSNASLDHDCLMEDYSSLAPNATAGGNVKIGAFSAVSLGANVIHGRCIGRHTVVGAGSLVIHDLPDYSVVLGSPAEVVRQRKEGDEYL